MEVPAEALLVGQAGDPHHHRGLELPRREEARAAGLAPELIERVVQVGEVLDLRDRQHPGQPEPLGDAQDRGLVEQRVEHPRRPEGLLQAGRDAVDTTLLPDVLPEGHRVWTGHELIAQRGVQPDREGPLPRGGRILREPPGMRGGPCLRGEVATRYLGSDGVRPVRGQRGHDLRDRREVTGRGCARLEGGDVGPDPFDDADQRVAVGRAGCQQASRRACDGVPGLGRRDVVTGAVRGLHVAAGVPPEPDRVEVEEHRCPAHAGEVERAGRRIPEVVDLALGADVGHPRQRRGRGRDPPPGAGYGDADAVVLADEDDRDGTPDTLRPAGRVDRGQGGRVVERRIAERTHHDRVLGEVVQQSQTLGAGDREGGPDRLRRMRGDRGGLRGDPQLAAAPDLVPPLRDRVVT